ncbi:MAG: hypothetical protein M3Y27_14915 [Acidobacteriota bacterium]|nr:hypothetical protein [Acidobacteriota bacterium]
MPPIKTATAARRLAKLRRTFAGGRPKVLRRCGFCKRLLGARELRAHNCQQ